MSDLSPNDQGKTQGQQGASAVALWDTSVMATSSCNLVNVTFDNNDMQLHFGMRVTDADHEGKSGVKQLLKVKVDIDNAQRLHELLNRLILDHSARYDRHQ